MAWNWWPDDDLPRLERTQASGAPETAAQSTQPADAVEVPPSTSDLDASGFVVARRQATVSADLTGRLTRINVVEGSIVERGDIIAELDTRISEAQVRYAGAQLRSAEGQADVIRAQISAAENTMERVRALAARNFASKAALDEATSAYFTLKANLAVAMTDIDVARQQLALQEAQLEITRIRAPFDGVVTEVTAGVGEIVSPISAGGGFTRTGICTIVDLDSLQGEIQVNERYLGRLRKGQPVRIKSPAYPDMRVNGHIETITAAVDRSTAAVTVIVQFDVRDPRLMSGMRLDVTFTDHD
jgi:RND family efflux transporter MFP subunit